jgi:hypothetical protein
MDYLALSIFVTVTARNLRQPSFTDHGLVAIAQNPLSPSTTCGFVNPAGMSVSINPVFGCPEYGVNVRTTFIRSLAS